MSAPTRRMLTSQEAADYCGFKSIGGFLAYVKVAPVNFGSNVRFDREALDEWLDNLGHSQPAMKRGFAERAGNDGGPRDRA